MVPYISVSYFSTSYFWFFLSLRFPILNMRFLMSVYPMFGVSYFCVPIFMSSHLHVTLKMGWHQKRPSSAPIIVNFCRIKSNDWRDVDYNCPETVPRLITRVWMAHDIKVLNTSMHSSSQGLTQKKCKITLVRNPFWPFLKKSS